MSNIPFAGALALAASIGVAHAQSLEPAAAAEQAPPAPPAPLWAGLAQSESLASSQTLPTPAQREGLNFASVSAPGVIGLTIAYQKPLQNSRVVFDFAYARSGDDAPIARAGVGFIFGGRKD